MHASRFVLALIVSCYAGTSFANHYYAGIGVGYDSTNFHKTLQVYENGNTVYDKTDNLNGNGLFANLLAGYSWNFGRHWMLATEVNGALSSLEYHGNYSDQNLENGSSRGKFTIDKSYGLSLLPGYFLTDNVPLYLRLGVVRGNFKYSEYKTDLVTGNTHGLTDSQWLTGIKYGVGIAAPVVNNIQLRIEYDCIQYNTYTDRKFPMPAGQTRTIKLTPISNLAELDLIYNFG